VASVAAPHVEEDRPAVGPMAAAIEVPLAPL
jgi:hypothetical protein